MEEIAPAGDANQNTSVGDGRKTFCVPASGVKDSLSSWFLRRLSVLLEKFAGWCYPLGSGALTPESGFARIIKETSENETLYGSQCVRVAPWSRCALAKKGIARSPTPSL